MKTTKTPAPESKKFAKQLKEHFSDEEIASFVLTLLGMSHLAHRFIWDEVRHFMELPIQVKYSTVQHASFYWLFSQVARGTLKKGNFSPEFMPIDDDAWQSDDDFEKRFIFVVKAFYESLKKEGKL